MYMRTREIPAALRDRLRRYFNARWRGRKVLDEAGIVAALPEPYARALALHACEATLRASPLLAAGGAGLRAALAPLLALRIVMEGEEICAQGEPAAALWLIERGVVGLYRDGRKFAELEDGAMLGDAALLFAIKAPYTARTETPCRLHALRRADFDAVFAEYVGVAAAAKVAAYKAMRRWGLAPLLRRRSEADAAATPPPAPPPPAADGAAGAAAAAAALPPRLEPDAPGAPCALLARLPWDQAAAEAALQAEAAAAGETIDRAHSWRGADADPGGLAARAREERMARYFKDIGGVDDDFDLLGRLRSGVGRAGEAIRKLPQDVQALQLTALLQSLGRGEGGDGAPLPLLAHLRRFGEGVERGAAQLGGRVRTAAATVRSRLGASSRDVGAAAGGADGAPRARGASAYSSGGGGGGGGGRADDEAGDGRRSRGGTGGSVGASPGGLGIELAQPPPARAAAGAAALAAPPGVVARGAAPRPPREPPQQPPATPGEAAAGAEHAWP
jgi:hypothetical protein